MTALVDALARHPIESILLAIAVLLAVGVLLILAGVVEDEGVPPRG